jgi:hypothetical protein
MSTNIPQELLTKMVNKSKDAGERASYNEYLKVYESFIISASKIMDSQLGTKTTNAEAEHANIYRTKQGIQTSDKLYNRDVLLTYEQENLRRDLVAAKQKEQLSRDLAYQVFNSKFPKIKDIKPTFEKNDNLLATYLPNDKVVAVTAKKASKQVVIPVAPKQEKTPKKKQEKSKPTGGDDIIQQDFLPDESKKIIIDPEHTTQQDEVTFNKSIAIIDSEPKPPLKEIQSTPTDSNIKIVNITLPLPSSDALPGKTKKNTKPETEESTKQGILYLKKTVKNTNRVKWNPNDSTGGSLIDNSTNDLQLSRETSSIDLSNLETVVI